MRTYLLLAGVCALVSAQGGSRFGSQAAASTFGNAPKRTTAPSQPAPDSSSEGFSGVCKEKNERYPVPGSCDRYIECLDGIAEEKVCPDGLRYGAKLKYASYPCLYPIDVPCLERASLQEPQPTDDCPNQFGYFKLGDERNCSSFRSCVNGRGYDFNCPVGLAFDPSSYRCDWPDLVLDCDAEAFLGFRCPEVPTSRELGRPAGFRFYRSDYDCQRYFLCVDGRPRLHVCGGLNAFDELTSSCVSAEEVDACPTELKDNARSYRELEIQRAEKELSLVNLTPEQKRRH